MSVEAPAAEPLQRTGNGTISAPPVSSKLARRLQLSPTAEHDPDDYHDLQNQLDFSPLLFTSLERYLPPPVMTLPREAKANYIRDILLRYSPEGERTRVRKHREYRERLLASYKPLHRELYGFDAAKFLDPSFLEAIKGNTVESIRSIVTEVSPGVFGFKMFQPRFCEMLLDEVDNFERWVHEINIRIMRPNTMNKFGVVLDDFGLETMLNKLMDDFLSPMAGVFFPEVGGATLDSHHGFVVQYGMDRDVELGFHVDDSEVTLNACLGEKFSGGELYFKGVRCDKHVNTETQQEEMMEVGHDPGFAFLHRGRHRHGARATTSGRRANLLMWCRSSLFRELKKYRTDFSSWCGECRRIKRDRHQSSMEAVKLELMKMERR